MTSPITINLEISPGKAVQSMCYAPHTNLFFDLQGRVKACCWNGQHILGAVAEPNARRDMGRPPNKVASSRAGILRL